MVVAALVMGALGASAACGGSKKPPVASTEADAGEADGGDDTFATGGGGDGADGGASKKGDECIGFDIANVEDLLLKVACEEPSVKPDALTPVDLKGKLEVTVIASQNKIPGGQKADLIVTFANKSKDPLVLHFKIDPVARFETEVWDQPTNANAKKGGPKRVDLPAGATPPPPKGATQPPSSEAKSARVTLAPNGTARARVPWEAVKMKWAPEKFRGTPPEKGFPRTAAGPLPRGKYTVKVVTPLIGVSEGVDREMSTPKTEIEIGG